MAGTKVKTEPWDEYCYIEGTVKKEEAIFCADGFLDVQGLSCLDANTANGEFLLKQEDEDRAETSVCGTDVQNAVPTCVLPGASNCSVAGHPFTVLANVPAIPNAFPIYANQIILTPVQPVYSFYVNPVVLAPIQVYNPGGTSSVHSINTTVCGGPIHLPISSAGSCQTQVEVDKDLVPPSEQQVDREDPECVDPNEEEDTEEKECENEGDKQEDEAVSTNGCYTEVPSEERVTVCDEPSCGVERMDETESASQNNKVDSDEQELRWGEEEREAVNGISADVRTKGCDVSEGEDPLLLEHRVHSQASTGPCSYLATGGITYKSSRTSPSGTYTADGVTALSSNSVNFCNLVEPEATTRLPGLSEFVEPSFRCDICDKLFRWKKSLKFHMLAHREVRPHICELCSKSFTIKASLKLHMLAHKNDRQFSCTICNKSFNFKGSLKTHLLIHSNVRPYKCEVCNRTFTQKVQLNMHMLRHQNLRPFPCEVCGRSFARKGDAKKHALGHETVRTLQCEICSLSFMWKSDLNAHLLIHQNIRAYRCDICDKSFIRKSDLNIHLLIHKNIRSFQCEVCNKAFVRKDNLTIHMLIHKNLRPFKCEICDKAFTQRGSVNRHMKIHKGVVS